MLRFQKLLSAMVLGTMVAGCGGRQAEPTIPAIGSPAPEILLPDSERRPVSIASLTREGPAVVVFHRGHW